MRRWEHWSTLQCTLQQAQCVLYPPLPSFLSLCLPHSLSLSPSPLTLLCIVILLKPLRLSVCLSVCLTHTRPRSLTLSHSLYHIPSPLSTQVVYSVIYSCPLFSRFLSLYACVCVCVCLCGTSGRG